MTTEQIIISLVLVITMGMFLWGRWRHDLVALGSLLACVFTGLIPGNDAFSGFGHPAVITVACVLVLGYGLMRSGAVDALAKKFLPSSSSPTVSILSLIALAALLSAFMNNVGALAIMMPLGIQLAAKLELPPGKILMPLAFGSILGGMTTLIGTPPNLIVAEYRANTGSDSFGMFDFTPVGLSVALVGILFIAFIGWRIVPHRKRADLDTFESGKYLSEVRVVEGSKIADKPLYEVERALDESDAQVISLIRSGVRIPAPNARRLLKADDILLIEVEPESLASVISNLGVVLEEEMPIGSDDSVEPIRANEDDDKDADKKVEEVSVQEMVVTPNASLVGRSAKNLWLRTLYGINLLAISRQGQRSIGRLRSTRIKPGDVLLLQGPEEALSRFASEFNCLPLAPRDIHIPKKRKAITAVSIMLAAISLTATGILPVAISFAAAMLAFIVLKIVPLRSMYTAIDWPVIVLLAAMLPVANAIATTGTADLLAHLLLDSLAQGHAVIALIAILVVTMFLSDVVNNAATAAVMCPIAISTASQLGVNTDAFLMAVAIGASCAFLTPIGHQNNTLILGPGGLKFGDFWRMGILMEIIVVAISVPVLLWVWPL